jgi:hypothetical protein
VNTITISNSGVFYHTAGTNHAVRLSVIDGGSYTSDGTLITSNTMVENYGGFPVRPRFVQSAGEHRAKQMLWLESGGVYELNGGVLSASQISLRAGTRLHLQGAWFPRTALSKSTEATLPRRKLFAGPLAVQRNGAHRFPVGLEHRSFHRSWLPTPGA